MKINYSILWFDDQLDKIEGYKRTLQRLVSDLGFQLVVDPKDSISSDEIHLLQNRLSVYNPYDLILFDHDMGHNITGASIAAELRASVFTDMVYYSASRSADLRKELYNNKVDGIFIAQRESFEDDMRGIITDHIKRICDLNNMRGLVLDFMSAIDFKLRDILVDRIKSDADKDKTLKYIQNKLNDRLKGLTKQSSKLSADSLCGFIYDFRYVDFNLVRSSLAHLLSSHLFLQSDQLLETMQKLRNDLAHQPYSINPNNNKAIISKNGVVSEYDFQAFVRIRKDLLKILDEINKM